MRQMMASSEPDADHFQLPLQSPSLSRHCDATASDILCQCVCVCQCVRGEVERKEGKYTHVLYVYM